MESRYKKILEQQVSDIKKDSAHISFLSVIGNFWCDHHSCKPYFMPREVPILSQKHSLTKSSSGRVRDIGRA
jgi:hypothetical protein